MTRPIRGESPSLIIVDDPLARESPCACTTSVFFDRVVVNVNRECPRHGVNARKESR